MTKSRAQIKSFFLHVPSQAPYKPKTHKIKQKKNCSYKNKRSCNTRCMQVALVLKLQVWNAAAVTEVQVDR